MLAVGLCHLNATLDFANTSKIFVQLALIVATEGGSQRLGAFVYDIEYAAAQRGSACASRWISRIVFIAEQALEHQARIRFGRHRGARGRPGDAVGVRAAVTGVAVADRARILAADFQRSEAHLVAKVLSNDLID